jgi:hypothetical protein
MKEEVELEEVEKLLKEEVEENILGVIQTTIIMKRIMMIMFLKKL